MNGYGWKDSEKRKVFKTRVENGKKGQQQVQDRSLEGDDDAPGCLYLRHHGASVLSN